MSEFAADFLRTLAEAKQGVHQVYQEQISGTALQHFFMSGCTVMSVCVCLPVCLSVVQHLSRVCADIRMLRENHKA